MNIKAQNIIYIALLSLAAAIIALLIIGTIYALVRSADTPLFTVGRNKTELRTVETQYDEIRTFSGLGRLRIPLSNSSVLVLSIAFPYSAADIAFSEELASKINELREIAINYFSSLLDEKLIRLDEDEAKAEILKRFNENLRLGRIEALYFSDMIVID